MSSIIEEEYKNRFMITNTPAERLWFYQKLAILAEPGHCLQYPGIHMIVAAEFNDNEVIVLLFKSEEDCIFYKLKYGNSLDV